ncbi:MAG: hypothetical protein QN229_05705 [Desulfurococcaceae archaeon TW002]
MERSRSKSDLHKKTTLYVVLNKGCEKVDYEVIEKISVTPTYSVGSAEIHRVLVPEDSLVIQASFTLNIKKRISGEILVLDSSGKLLCRAIYRKLKVRVTYGGDPLTMKLLKCLFDSLKLVVKKYKVLQIAKIQ